jgi:hypothetical protein
LILPEIVISLGVWILMGNNVIDRTCLGLFDLI